ncbi:MAG: Endo-1,4-beta-xylanase A precursor [Verrucomicrobia bacterium ADurb.Bin345]|nr:MAG: Endo-1,4-beta-xylanase A precursor [Verrucomicrobia bacterium ADurb.Bin345]
MSRSALFILAVSSLVLVAVSAVEADTTNLAAGEVFVNGVATGTYTRTHSSDNNYQTISEIETLGKPATRYSHLEHKWTFNVTGGESVMFHVEAHHSASTDGDHFVFAYSRDGSTYTDMLTVTKTSDNNTAQTFALPADLHGTVFIRARDTDRTPGNRARDTLYVDHLSIVSSGEPPPVVDNLILNPGFEEGTVCWWGYNDVGLTAVTSPVHSGKYALHVTNRNYYWQGPIHDLYNIMARDMSYSNTVWVRLDGPGSDTVTLTIRQITDSGESFIHLDSKTVTSGAWVQLSAPFTLSYTGRLQALHIYVEGPQPGVNFYVDEMVVQGSGAWEEEANARIEQLRKRDMRFHIYDALGRPLTNANVEIRQTRRHFAFGSALSRSVISNRAYASFFTNHFEWAVFENEMKWGYNEREEGDFYYEDADAMYAFCVSNNIRMRGHCVFWEVEDFVQDWVRSLVSNTNLLMASVSNRMRDVAARYGEHIEHWDVNNEMMHGSFYSTHLGSNIWPWMFQQMNEAVPQAQLFVNDYGVVSYSDTDKYKAHIQSLISNGAPVHAVGAQCHMFELNPYLVLSRLESLGELGLPVWCTEFDVAHPDENVRARQLEIFYRSAFSHPAVHGILMWGFWASNHWRGADAALVNADFTTNAAGRRYEQLMAEWTTVTNRVTDAAGTARVRGFHGTYRVAVTPQGGAAEVFTVELEPGEGTNEVVLVAAGADSDGDGVPDAWKTFHGMDVGGKDAGEDPDEDGLSNLEEYIAFTCPMDSSSHARVYAWGDAMSLEFETAPHRFYAVDRRTNLLAGAWIPWAAWRQGTGGAITFTNAPDGYYRLRTRMP